MPFSTEAGRRATNIETIPRMMNTAVVTNVLLERVPAR